ncbi:hypothetical protein [Arthrobacter sp. H41]|uniref:hypothetical protein n=1 Tax=Arthrobacter sp. H41 TaxID=1312978 RepID=UPI00047CA908|nr:hypothetical protein [Arthrobacter sp. H41]
MTFTENYFTHNRLALALFRATSVEDADALAVLERTASELPAGELEAVEKMTLNMFAAAARTPTGVGPDEFFDAYSKRLDELEAEHRAGS